MKKQALWRAKRVALYGLKHEQAKEFGILTNNLHEIVKCNQGSYGAIKKVNGNENGPPVLQRVFLS